MKSNQGRWILFAAVLILLSLFLLGCRQEEDIIGLHRPVYNTSEATIRLHYFPVQSQAEAFYRDEGIEEYFLFTMPGRDASVFFEELEAREIANEGKELEFQRDGEETARDQVVDFIDEHNLWNVRN